MKSVIASLFAIYSLTSGSNRLLQQVLLPENQPAAPQSTVGLPPLTLPALPTAPALERKCVVAYDAGTPTKPTCAGTTMEINNPVTHFKLYCNALGACAAATINFNYSPGHSVERIEIIQFSETYAGYNAVVTINNMMGGNPLNLDKLECKKPGACENLKVHLNNAVITNVNCPYPSYCANCEVFTAGNPVGIPCHSLH